MLREFCAQNTVNVREAIHAGARRVELCDNLAIGGVTPNEEVIARAVELTHGLGASVMVMVRPRGGDFAYNKSELLTMERTIGVARDFGADGVVFGCVKGGALDENATQRLAQAAAGLDLTFHMAFDEICPHLQPQALAILADMRFSRVLVHGGSLNTPIDRCMPHLHELVAAADTRISIMPGGGVTWQNVNSICKELGVHEAHGTRIVRW